jgi:hypothetical protein
MRAASSKRHRLYGTFGHEPRMSSSLSLVETMPPICGRRSYERSASDRAPLRGFQFPEAVVGVPGHVPLATAHCAGCDDLGAVTQHPPLILGVPDAVG